MIVRNFGFELSSRSERERGRTRKKSEAGGRSGGYLAARVSHNFGPRQGRRRGEELFE